MEESLNRSQSYRVHRSVRCALHFFDELLNTRKHRGDICREPAFLRQGVKRHLPICWRWSQTRWQIVRTSSVKS